MIVAAFSIALIAHMPKVPRGETTPLGPVERAVHLLSRFAFGPGPGEVDRLLELGEEAWLEEQLDPERREGPLLMEQLGLLDTLGLNPTQIYEYTYFELPANFTRKERHERSMRRAIPMRQLVGSIPLRQTLARRQVQEVMAEFWRNHFNVSYSKGWPAGLFIPDYDARVIQEHALGSFSELLNASAHHSAMMHYLDNWLSKRPPTSEELAKYTEKVRERTGSKELAAEARNIAAKRGLNENYARELLELHTLGVDRGYSQADVVAAAQSLTGWGLADGRGGEYGFFYAKERHIKGNRTFLKTVLREDKKGGTSQGDRLLAVLANHTDTSQFIATKLVRYLVNDVPPPALVKDVAKVFRKRKGSVQAMLQTILESDEFWSRKNYQAKFKTPNEFLISALRITGAQLDNTDELVDALRAMGQPTYRCDDPTGYYDTAQAWLDPGVLSIRWDIALRLAAGEIEGVRVPDTFFGSIGEDGSALRWMQQLIGRVLPGGVTLRTQAMVHEVVREYKAKHKTIDVLVLGPKILGLLLGSPEFQRQ